MAVTRETGTPLRQGIAAITSLAAATLLLAVGVLSLLQGISALVDDELFVAGARYIYEFDTTTWGWIHIVLGIFLSICALGLMSGSAGFRGAAIGIAAVSIIANFLSLPYYPAWSILIIALNVVVIWAVATWRPDQM